MTKKKMPQTLDECNTEIAQAEQQLRQYENRNKMLERKIAIEKRKERNHRLCLRGGYIKRHRNRRRQDGKGHRGGGSHARFAPRGRMIEKKSASKCR